jgi:23S rRNA (adenine2503-C2)-methyltransferase
VKERNCYRSTKEDIEKFKTILEKYRKTVTIRREMGSDIDAACGQLRKKFLTKNGRN